MSTDAQKPKRVSAFDPVILAGAVTGTIFGRHLLDIPWWYLGAPLAVTFGALWLYLRFRHRFR